MAVFDIKTEEAVLNTKYSVDKVVNFGDPNVSSGYDKQGPRVGYSVQLEFIKSVDGGNSNLSRESSSQGENDLVEWDKMTESAVVDLEKWKLKQKEIYKAQVMFS
jgi:hypothetical protein